MTMSAAWVARCRIDGTFDRSATGAASAPAATASSVRGRVRTARVTFHPSPPRDTPPRTSCEATSPVMSKTLIAALVKPATATCRFVSALNVSALAGRDNAGGT